RYHNGAITGPMPFPIHPRAVVTGAGSGLGRAFCMQLARRGARLVVSDVDLAAAEATIAALPTSRSGGAVGGGGSGTEAHAVKCDVSKIEEVQALADTADKLLGGVDLVV